MLYNRPKRKGPVETRVVHCVFCGREVQSGKPRVVVRSGVIHKSCWRKTPYDKRVLLLGRKE